MINFSLPRTASDIYFISYISELIQGVRSQLGVNNTKLPYNTWASAQARSLSHSTTRAPSLLHSTCWLLWQCREPQWLLIGSWLILWEEPADDEETQVLRAQLGLFTLTEEQGIEVERGMAWEKSEIQMKILRVCWSQRQWTWNFKKSKLFGINSEF